jgi:hypothetical protein
MRHTTILLMILVVNLASCGDSAPQPQSDGIIGTWRWESSEGGIFYRVVSPSTEGYTMKLVIKSDDTYLLYKADTLIETGGYVLGSDPAWTIGWQEKEMIKQTPHYGPTECPAVIDLYNDTLRLRVICPDGFTPKFSRIH